MNFVQQKILGEMNTTIIAIIYIIITVLVGGQSIVFGLVLGDRYSTTNYMNMTITDWLLMAGAITELLLVFVLVMSAVLSPLRRDIYLYNNYLSLKRFKIVEVIFKGIVIAFILSCSVEFLAQYRDFDVYIWISVSLQILYFITDLSYFIASAIKFMRGVA